jgi:acyl-homoserine lactone acylase PvdQ
MYNIDKVIAAGYTRYLPAFEVLVPALQKAFATIAKEDSLYAPLVEPVATLTNWNFECSKNSVATTLAVEWAERLSRSIQQVYINQGETDQVQKTKQFAATATPQQLLQPLKEVVTTLQTKFGSWQLPWGQLNRYQRVTGNITETYNDAQPSLPVGFTASAWGCLPSFVSVYMPGTQKRYGISGNSFVCVVEFGKKIKAKSVLAGGVNSVPSAAAFSNQALNYTQGRFKDVLFYKEDVLRNAVKTYKPGE